MTEPESTEPVSWLRLERYHLGELPPDEAEAVERRIATDPETRECFESIRRPVRLNPRPELPFRAEVPAPESPLAKRRRLRDALRSPWPTLLLAAAAAFFLYVSIHPTNQPDGAPPPRLLHVKGGDVSIELVRERHGVVTPNPVSFAEGDRFKVKLTCPPSMTKDTFEVLVIQAQDASRPLAPLGAVACGNGVALPGAFSLTGAARTSVCVAWGGTAQTDGRLGSKELAALRGSAVCATLRPDR
jgi:anti-sigma-K factor RskA